jgi:hypothetical protein
VLYRVFPWLPDAEPAQPGGPLFVPRLDQGQGRHDNPDAYGCLYLSRSTISPVAEVLRDYVGRPVEVTRLLREGSPLSLASINDTTLDTLVDLDDPGNLVARELRPSRVATRDREATRPMALSLYREGVDGFEWWSTIEASWINVTLFEDRVTDRLTLVGEPEPLTLDHPAVREAAEAIGVLLAK